MKNPYKEIHHRNLLIVLLIALVILMCLDGAVHWETFKHLGKEFIIVIIAAIVVSGYFEFHLRNQVSTDFNNILVAKEEFAKAGVTRYYANFKDVNIRSFFKKDLKLVDIYVTYGNSFFKSIEDKLTDLAKSKDVQLNIFILSKDNPFLPGLGNLWGQTNSEYNEAGIKEKIDLTSQLLKGIFEKLAAEGKLNAKIQVAMLKRHPVFYSFYRFDDEMLYVPSKLIEPKTFIPLTFIVRRTIESEGIYNKCMKELDNIKSDVGSLDVIFASL